MPPISTSLRICECLFVLLVAVGKFVFMDYLKMPVPFIFTVGGLTILYIIVSNIRVPGMTTYWGFRKDNFVKLSRRLALPALATVVICMVVGYFRDTLIIHWHILPLLVIYPLWGVLQQYMCMALVAGNLQDMPGDRISKPMIILITSLLFGAMHLPNIPLAIGTFLLARVYGIIYLKQRNLFVLGILHGWLGAVFYYTVIGEDQWAKVFGN